MRLSQDVVSSFCPAKMARTHSQLHFSPDGSALLATDSPGTQLEAWDAVRGTKAATHFSYKYGCTVPTFTNSNSSVLCGGFT